MQIESVIKKKSYEEVIFKLHRHPLTFIPIIGLFLIMLIVPIGVYFLIDSLFPALLVKDTTLYAVTVLLGSTYFLLSYVFFYVRFIDYYLDMWVVTNDRIVDIEQHGLFNRVITELDLFRIQDVTANVSGLFGTLFRYGDVIITTASANTHIVFRNVPGPNHIRERLIQLADEDRKFHYGTVSTLDSNLDIPHE